VPTLFRDYIHPRQDFFQTPFSPCAPLSFFPPHVSRDDCPILNIYPWLLVVRVHPLFPTFSGLRPTSVIRPPQQLLPFFQRFALFFFAPYPTCQRRFLPERYLHLPQFKALHFTPHVARRYPLTRSFHWPPID